MDNLFLEEFVEPVDPKKLKEIHINNNNTFQLNNNLDEIDDYNINTETIIHKQENISSSSNENKIYDISSLYTKQMSEKRILISYTDMNASNTSQFNGSYEYQFNLNQMYKNVIGFKLKRAIYENNNRKNNGSNTNVYMDVIVNNIPKEACIDNLSGDNIIERLPFEYNFSSSGSGVEYAGFSSNIDYFYPINLNSINLSLKYNYNGYDFVDLKKVSEENKANTVSEDQFKFSFEFVLTILNIN